MAAITGQVAGWVLRQVRVGVALVSAPQSGQAAGRPRQPDDDLAIRARWHVRTGQIDHVQVESGHRDGRRPWLGFPLLHAHRATPDPPTRPPPPTLPTSPALPPSPP